MLSDLRMDRVATPILEFTDRDGLTGSPMIRLGGMVEIIHDKTYESNSERLRGYSNMIDHITVYVSDFETSKNFYTQALKPLGYELIMDFNMQGTFLAGFGEGGKPDFWLSTRKPTSVPGHVAFRAKNRAEVNQFYQAALAAGAKDNGKPGIREMYHPDFYGAFVIGPDGHNIEAVTHLPE